MPWHSSICSDLEPHDRVIAAVIRRALKDMQQGAGKHQLEAHDYLAGLGMVNSAGEVVVPSAQQLAERLG